MEVSTVGFSLNLMEEIMLVLLESLCSLCGGGFLVVGVLNLTGERLVCRILVRPHPVFWRFIHGLAIIYLVFLTFLLFQVRCKHFC